MKYAVIDVGSNSVRLLLWSDGKTLYKQINTTRLGEGLSITGSLSERAMLVSAEAIRLFKEQALREGADGVFAFATAAVRSAKNGADFTALVKRTAGLEVDVISGTEEGEIGLSGAIGKADGGIIDIGGASTELTLREGGMPAYSKSLDIGAVRLFDLCGRNRAALTEVIDEKIAEYGKVNCNVPVYGIGGTNTSLAALSLGLKTYAPAQVQDYALTRALTESLTDKLFQMSAEEIVSISCLPYKRAEIIAGGALLLSRLMEYLQLERITVSEKDNLEGYLMRRLGL